MRAVPPSLVSRPLRAALLALGLGLGLSAVSLSFAQGNMHGMHATLGGHGMHAASASDPQAMHGKMAERRTQRLAALKQKLAITPEQEAAWTAWTGALQQHGPMAAAGHARDRAKEREQMRAEMAQLTTPERIDRMRALRAQHQSRMDQRADATKAFYAALNAEQRKLFDAETARLMQRGGHRGDHHGGHPHG